MQKIKKRIIFIIFLIFLLFFGFLFLDQEKEKNETKQFNFAYHNYEKLSKEQENATYMPGADSNSIRQDLDRILSAVLTQNMENNERLKMAKEGMKLIKKLEAQIDLIGIKGEQLSGAVSKMEEAGSNLSDKEQKDYAEAIVQTAKEKLSISSDIRGLSYRANYHVVEIFKRIISDKGELTSSHIKFLNDKIPEVEEQFNKRSGLYDELGDLNNKLNAEYNDFENSL